MLTFLFWVPKMPKTAENNVFTYINLWTTMKFGFHRTEEKKSRVRETKHLSTDADRSTDGIGGWTKAKSATQKKLFLARRF